MIDFIKSRITSFKNAFEGLRYALRTQKNAWIHLLATIIAIILGIWLKIDLIEWALIILCFAIVWGAELFNTSIETVFDLISEDHSPRIKIGKDLGAGAVLVASVAALIISFIIFLPKIIPLLK